MKTAITKLIMTAKGQVSKNITSMLGNCRFDSKQNKIYTGYNSGRGRYTSACSAKGLQVAAWKLSNIAKDKGLKISKTAFFHSL